MSVGLLFWIVYIVAMVIYVAGFDRPSFAWWQIVVFGLIFLLGWAQFGWPIQRSSKPPNE